MSKIILPYIPTKEEQETLETKNFIVRCDESNNHPNIVDKNELVIDIIIKNPSPELKNRLKG